MGPEDPVYQKFESVISGYADMVQELRELIEKGNVIEGFKEDTFVRLP